MATAGLTAKMDTSRTTNNKPDIAYGEEEEDSEARYLLQVYTPVETHP